MHLDHDLTTFVALFAIMNPFGAIPLFLALTPPEAAVRRRIAVQTGIATLVTLVVAYFLGDLILALFRINMDAFRIAGALIIAAAGWAMVFGRAATAYGDDNRSPAVIPLAIPKLAGPGAMAVVIALGQKDQGSEILEDVLIIALLTVLTVAMLMFATPIERLLRENGMNIMTRIFGLLLLAIAIGSMMTSLADYFPAWVNGG